MRKESDNPLRNGSPLNDRPMSLPPTTPTHESGERRLSLYDNIDIYYNDHYEQSMEESLEMINTPTGQKVKPAGPLYQPDAGPPIPIPDGGHVPIGASSDSLDNMLEPPGPPPPLQKNEVEMIKPIATMSGEAAPPKRPIQLGGITIHATADNNASSSSSGNVINGTNNKEALKPTISTDSTNTKAGPFGDAISQDKPPKSIEFSFSAPISTSQPAGKEVNKSVVEGSPVEKNSPPPPPQTKPKSPPPPVKPKPKSTRSPVNGVPHFKTHATLV